MNETPGEPDKLETPGFANQTESLLDFGMPLNGRR
jgi:hypothetical protein